MKKLEMDLELVLPPGAGRDPGRRDHGADRVESGDPQAGRRGEHPPVHGRDLMLFI